MSDSQITALLFVQLMCILAVCRGLGWLFARMRQPLVVAEMVAGFLLGPSFLGWLMPHVKETLFPAASLPTLFALSQVGLVLYMFCVGLEFRLDLVARYGRRAIGVSVAGIALPFAFGGALALVMMRSGGFFTAHVSDVHAVLFLGAAMSITAFPVLARIIGPLTAALLVPLFFINSGLNTHLTLIDSRRLLAMTVAVFLTAYAGKGLACWAAARLSGAKPREALAIATLMNARGMVELILANLGLQRGLITLTLFAMLVMMAIGTTVMTGPLFSLIWEREGEPAVEPGLNAERVRLA